MKGALRVTLYGIGLTAMGLGVLFVLMGAGIVPIGPMAHDTPWIYRGAMLGFAGVVVALVSRSMRNAQPPPPA